MMCSSCKYEYQAQLCLQCDGDGRLGHHDYDGQEFDPETADVCDECNGFGEVEACPQCGERIAEDEFDFLHHPKTLSPESEAAIRTILDAARKRLQDMP